jgi:hypothetical protein
VQRGFFVSHIASISYGNFFVALGILYGYYLKRPSYQETSMQPNNNFHLAHDGSNILPFPVAAIDEMPRAIPSLRDRMTFNEVAREMCLDWHKRNCGIIEKLRSLHRHQSMPLPENPRFKSGVPCKGAENICAHSIWSRQKFMAWKHRGAEQVGIGPAERRAVEGRLARNAALVAGTSGAL